MARDDKITAGKIFKWKECLKEFMDGKDHEACYQKMKVKTYFKICTKLEYYIETMI